MTAKQHADASPSASHQWLNCPASVTLAKGRTRVPTTYTREGTAAHRVAEMMLHGAKKIPGEMLVDGELVQVTPEMVDAAETYVSYVRQASAGSMLHIEKRVDVGHGVFGTADSLIVGAPKIEIVDFKYGQGVAVYPDSPQLKIYALGALNYAGPFEDIRSVDLTVVQPRTDPNNPVSTVNMSVTELSDWEVLTLAPALALLEAGDTTETPGDWCRWCVRAGECKALAAQAQSNAKVAFGDTPPDPVGMTDDELGAVLDYAQMISDWIRKVQAEASQRIDHGTYVPGWKLVAKRAVRRWEDPTGAISALMKKGIDPMDVMRIETIGTVEKIMKRNKVRADTIDPFTIKQSSGSTLVSEKDGRPAIDNSAQAVFGELSEM